MMGNVILTRAILSVWNMQHQTKVKSNEKNEWACLQENTHARRLWFMEEAYEQIKCPLQPRDDYKNLFSGKWKFVGWNSDETRQQQTIVKCQH